MNNNNSAAALVHTEEQLRKLHPDTILLGRFDEDTLCHQDQMDWMWEVENGNDYVLPLVVLVTGDEYGAAHDLLENLEGDND